MLPTVQHIRYAIAVLTASVTLVAHAGPWNPIGPSDAYTVPDFGFVATHPAVGGQAIIEAGFVPSIAQSGTWFTSDGGSYWEAHARQGGFGRPWLAGTPTIAYLDLGNLLRSTDTGRTWAPLILPAPPLGQSFEIGGVNPLDANELIVFAGSSVLRSTNGGATWSTDIAPAVISAMVVDWSTRRLYTKFATGQPVGHRAVDTAGAWGVGGTSPSVVGAGHAVVLYQDQAGALFRSTDGGVTFNPVGQPLGSLSVCAFAFGAAARVYALECSSGRILRSDDDGGTWSPQASIPSGYAPQDIAADAANAAQLYVATARGVWISEDGAASVHPIPRATAAPGADRRLIQDGINPQLQWAAAETQGFFRSTDGGASWSLLLSASYPIASSRTRTGTLFGVTVSFSAGTNFAVSTDAGTTWNPKVPAPGANSRFGPIAYGASPGQLFLYVIGGGGAAGATSQIHMSSDDGETWGLRFAPPIGVNAMVAAQSGPTALYAGGSAATDGAPQLYRSTDNAVTWQPVATFTKHIAFDGGIGNSITALAIDPTNTSRLYAGFYYPDYLMRSEDAGATWTRITSGLGAGRITSIVIDPVNASTLYVSQLGSGVFRSTDRGATWTALDSGLGDDMVLKLEHDSFTPGRLYASTGSGIFQTQLTTGLPTGSRRAIEFFHHDFNHYFVSADNDEIAGLDAGVFQGWARTGEGFRVTEGTTFGSLPVCRFFGVGFAPLSSHFYTPYPNECNIVKADPKWLYEKIAFGLVLPDANTKGCPTGYRALYRAWNANENGAPNHRYTVSTNTLEAMLAQGWIFEGEAQTRVFACVPYLQ